MHAQAQPYVPTSAGPTCSSTPTRSRRTTTRSASRSARRSSRPGGSVATYPGFELPEWFIRDSVAQSVLSEACQQPELADWVKRVDELRRDS